MERSSSIAGTTLAAAKSARKAVPPDPDWIPHWHPTLPQSEDLTWQSARRL